MDRDTKDSRSNIEYLTDDIKLEPLLESEKERLLEFYREFHERGKQIITFYKWRQKDNPFYVKGVDYVAKANEKIVGAMGLEPMIHTHNGNKIIAFWHRDTLISPIMRGKGLVKRLLRAASEESMVLTKGSNEKMYKVRKSLGWRDVPNSDYLVHVLEPWPEGKSLKKKFLQFLLYIWSKILFSIYVEKDKSCYETNMFSDYYDIIAKQSSTAHEFKIYKTRAYLNWRYCNCPGRKYIILETGSDKVKGAIVLRLPSEQSGEAWIVDLICNFNDKNIVKDLLFGAFKWIKKHGASKILVFSTSTKMRRILFRFGFISLRRSPKFTYIIKPNHELYKAISNIEWNFWHGDSDNELYE
jgi:hypothetical protein